MLYFRSTLLRHRSSFITIRNKACFHLANPNDKEHHVLKIRTQKDIAKQTSVIANITVENQHEVISDKVTPHWKLSYDEELNIKQKLSEDAVHHVLNAVGQKNDNIVRNIIPSPVRDAYRNKDEFSVWPGLDGNQKTVGFFVGSPAVGKVVCVPATSLKCIKESHKRLAELYQDFIRSSPLPVSYQLFDKGFWRYFIVKSNIAGDHMATVVTLPGNFTHEQTSEQLQLLKDYISQHFPSLSLYHQSCRHMRCTREQAPLEHLCGEPYLTEKLGNLTMRLSPDSFFQHNKAAAEIMYEEVVKVAQPKHFSSLLDLYCGVGVVSLLASERARGCVGIDETHSAVEDATHNATSNNITNCTFVQGKVELALPGVLKKMVHATEMIAVVNPGQGGAAESVISLLRNHRHLRRVVYISCKPDNALTRKNFVQLCERMSQGSRAFYLTSAQPVDLFPYTKHYELILCFDKR